MTTLSQIVKDLQSLYNSKELPSGNLREMMYQTTGILKEIEQKLEGGYFSESYIYEKLDEIRFKARGVARND